MMASHGTYAVLVIIPKYSYLTKQSLKIGTQRTEGDKKVMQFWRDASKIAHFLSIITLLIPYRILDLWVQY